MLILPKCKRNGTFTLTAIDPAVISGIEPAVVALPNGEKVEGSKVFVDNGRQSFYVAMLASDIVKDRHTALKTGDIVTGNVLPTFKKEKLKLTA